MADLSDAAPALTPRGVATGFSYGEGPRWHDGHLWFSDAIGGRVLSLGDGDELTIRVEVPRPSGLGWFPDGRLVVASMALHDGDGWGGAARVLVGPPSALVPVVDMGTAGSFNDMVVGPDGSAYLDFYRGTPQHGEILRLTPDLQLSVAATDVVVPNGMTIDEDGRHLLVCETGADRISVFDIAADGTLSGKRTFAEGLPGPDGLCLDAEGAVWVGCFRASEFRRVHDGGACTARVAVPRPRWAVAPMLGGPDRRTLYLISNDTDRERLGNGASSGYLDALEVDVPGAGWP